MRTLYIDIFFLVNFTVDLLAMHFASKFSKVEVRSVRLIASSLFGGLYACITVFLPHNIFLTLGVSLLFLAICIVIAAGKCTFYRSIKLLISFFVFLTLFGGIVYFAFELADRFLPNIEQSVAENRNLLLLAIFILLGFGLFKLLFVLFYNVKSEKNARIAIVLDGKKRQVDAFVDSGNLLRDPIDTTPVMLIKKQAWLNMFSVDITEVENGNIPEEYVKRIRFIPLKSKGETKLLVGIRPQETYIYEKKGMRKVHLMLAIDEDGGTFGGYEALLPASVYE